MGLVLGSDWLRVVVFYDQAPLKRTEFPAIRHQFRDNPSLGGDGPVLLNYQQDHQSIGQQKKESQNWKHGTLGSGFDNGQGRRRLEVHATPRICAPACGHL